MKDFLITFFLGYLGVHKFMQKKYGMGALYLCTLGLFGFGWMVDTIRAFMRMLKGEQQVQESHIFTQENTAYLRSGKQLIKSFDTIIVGTFAKCALEKDETRQNMIGYIKPNWELYLKFWRYKGDPAYYVLHPNGVDVGCVRAGLAKILYEEYGDCEFKVTATSREWDEYDNETFNIRIDIYR